MKNKKVIFLLDMDAFFASCHMAEDPNLRNKNLVVASPNRRAIITTASYNARKFGIRAGTPVFQAKEMCPDLYVVNSDFSLYIKYSEQVFDIIYNNFTKDFEVASIDECYIDMTKVWKKFGSVKRTAQSLIDMIYEQTGLTSSIGISTNKFLAKSCVDFNKPKGISFLLENEIEEKLWPLPIKEMYMIGSATEKILNDNNIFTIKDLALSDLNKIIDLLGKRGLTLWYWANGKGDDQVSREASEFKSIGNELTLNFTTTNYEELEEIIYEVSMKIADRAKKRYLQGTTVTIVVKYLDDSKTEIYNNKDRKKHLTKQESFQTPTNDPEIIYSIAKQCFYELWKGQPILLLGVRLSNLSNQIEQSKQLSIDEIDLNEGIDYNEIEQIIYNLNLKFGKDKIFTGDKLVKYMDKNIVQSKFLKNDDVHISNQQIVDKWKNK
ncbi:Y-family DNA polymerase [Spiroplasma monobiae]|uniref:DNA polymerase IV n=1 Tax=Spiroplasma monobiae MQ-1 TaxID=1336748 RepID=A0A2K9LUU0_SPISQ|nr:DNA polymerase IV [Spiroplasma monobiae]AUM62681.1 DNA polymerase IV [Spiroplasma monobiae MQ-1]